MNIRRAAIFLSAVFLIAAQPEEGAGCGGPRPKVTIRLGTSFPAGHILADTGERFKALVEERTKGRIEVQVTPALASEEEVNLRTSRGEVDIQTTGGPPIQVFAPQYFFFNGPYVIQDYAHFLRVWNGELGSEAKELIRKSGHMLSLGTVYRGFRQMTSKKPIAGPADLVGLKLRLPTVPTWISVWTALETMPVAVPLPMLYESLRSGQADASEGDLTQISAFKLWEVQSHLSLTNHLVGVGWVFANETFWEGLSRHDRKIVAEAMEDAASWATDKIIAGEAALLTSLQQNGMTLVTPDAAAIREKARPAVEQLFTTEWPVTTWAEVLAQ